MTDVPQTDGKNLVELLDMLKPIPEPEPISMFPATEGWIWLGLALLAALGLAGRWGWRKWQANAYRRAALAELDTSRNNPAAVAAILRRAALVAYPRRRVAPLTGPVWTRFLEETCEGADFGGAAGAALAEAPYRGGAAASPELTEQARHWLKKHRAEAPA